MKITITQTKMLMESKIRDYQNRGSNYPASNMPDHIRVQENETHVFFSAQFKNTNERTAERWTRRFLGRKLGLAAKNCVYLTDQTGDYHDDWVDCDVMFRKWGK